MKLLEFEENTFIISYKSRIICATHAQMMSTGGLVGIAIGVVMLILGIVSIARVRTPLPNQSTRGRRSWVAKMHTLLRTTLSVCVRTMATTYIPSIPIVILMIDHRTRRRELIVG